MKIELSEIGREKWHGVIERPDSGDAFLIAEAACYEARKHLMSKVVAAFYDDEKNEGSISVGFRVVGRFKVLREEKYEVPV